MGAPITGMIVLGVVQTLLALIDDLPDAERAVQRARQPRGGHQRHSLHRRAVGAAVMMKGRKSPRATTLNMSSPWSPWSTACCALRLRQGRRDGRHARARYRLHHLGLHRAALPSRPRRRREGRPSRCPTTDGEQHQFEAIAPAATRRSAARPSRRCWQFLFACRLPARRRRRPHRDSGHIKLGYLADARRSHRNEQVRPMVMQWTSAEHIADQVKRDSHCPA